VFDSPFDERLLYQWLGGDQGWNLYSPGAPALVQTIEEILPHHTFFAAGTEPLLMLPAELNFGSCDTVALIGGDTGPLDTAVTRTQDANPDFPAGEGEVEVQLVALSLVSVEPITVTFNDGRDPQEWDVQVCLSDQQTGRMTIQLNEEDGGTSDADFPVPESDG